MPERGDSKIIGELLGLLAHDLRNPLSALHSNLGFLRSIATGDNDTREAIEDGMVSCDGLAHIIDNIDMLGQALRGTERPEGSVLDLAPVVAEVASSTRAMAQSHGVQVVLAPSTSGSATGQGSREFITRALANLVRNAIQHSPPGGKVSVGMRRDPTEYTIVVSDSGAHLAAGDESVFTAAGQVGAKSIPNGRYSRGLGLYAAGLAASWGQAVIRVAPPPEGASNAFELVVARRA